MNTTKQQRIGLKENSDEFLVKKVIEDNCNDSFMEIVSRHESLYYKICKKYEPVFVAKGINLNDVNDDKLFVIYKAITSYKSEKKIKISSWIGSFTKYYCLTKLTHYKPFSPLDESWGQNLAYSPDNSHTTDYIFNVLSSLKDERISKVFKLRYFSKNSTKLPWREIGKTLGLSNQTVSNLHDTGIKILRSKLKSESCMDAV